LRRRFKVAILALHRAPSLTRERYEEVVRRLTNGKVPVESVSELPFEGLLFHAAGESENGFCVMDVFESEAAVERFREAVTSIAEEVGIEQPPEFFPAHTFVMQ
jgi:hypothetical protein